jgi:LacI family transcriptional regulator
MDAVGMREVAEHAGVSIATVSNVLNRPLKVRPATIDRVQRAMDELGFVRNDAARRLKRGRSNSIGLVIEDFANPFFIDIARAIEASADEVGLSVLLGDSNRSPERELSYLDVFEQQRVEGLIIAPVGSVDGRVDRVASRGTPTVLLDRQPGSHAFSSVALDDRAGGRLALGHLASLGRRRVDLVGGPMSIPQVGDRFAGARAAAKRYGVEVRQLLTTELSFDEGERIGRELVAGREIPDGIFAANDLVALGLVKALHMEGGIDVPGRVAVVGYDDIALARHSLLPLASIQQPSAEIGQTALALLLDEMHDPQVERRQILLPPRLVVRDSAR